MRNAETRTSSGWLEFRNPQSAIRIAQDPLVTTPSASKEWIIRQYDHEVQGGSVIKPLVGVAQRRARRRRGGHAGARLVAGLAIGCGINPRYGDLDPYAMAAAAIDEAVRNVVAVGADPTRIAILDNFCWGNVNDPEVLGSLVRAAEACRDVALAFGTPFISGKDSLNNEFHVGDRRISHPAARCSSPRLGRVPDVRQCVTMDLKEPGNDLYLVGVDEGRAGRLALPPGHRADRRRRCRGSTCELAPKVFAAVHAAITQGLVRACHDLSEGGLAVALAEMAFAGGVGADVTDLKAAADGLSDEVAAVQRIADAVRGRGEAGRTRRRFEAVFAGLPLAKIGTTVKEPRLRIAGGERRVAGLGEAGRAEGGVAEAVEMVGGARRGQATGDVTLAWRIGLKLTSHPP